MHRRGRVKNEYEFSGHLLISFYSRYTTTSEGTYLLLYLKMNTIFNITMYLKELFTTLKIKNLNMGPYVSLSG